MHWTAKTYESRLVEIPPATVQALADWRLQGDGSPYVFVSLRRLERLLVDAVEADGQLKAGRRIKPNISGQFKTGQPNQFGKRTLSIQQRAGIAPLGTIHDLRKSYGCLWSRIVQPFELKAKLGHQSLETTTRHYVDNANPIRLSSEKAMASYLAV